jgi:hypothetical protein
MTENIEIGIKDINGVELVHGDYVRFDFSDLMDTPFIGSNFGKTIKKQNLEKCIFHFMSAKKFQPDYGWHNTLCYVIYFVKDGDIFLTKENRDPEDKPYVRKGDEPNYFDFDVDPRFLVYITGKNGFTKVGHSENVTLTVEEVVNS